MIGSSLGKSSYLLPKNSMMNQLFLWKIVNTYFDIFVIFQVQLPKKCWRFWLLILNLLLLRIEDKKMLIFDSWGEVGKIYFLVLDLNLFIGNLISQLKSCSISRRKWSKLGLETNFHYRKWSKLRGIKECWKIWFVVYISSTLGFFLSQKKSNKG